MSKRRWAAVLILVSISTACHASIRTIGLDYGSLTEKADLVVIARPIKVHEPGEITNLPSTQKDYKMIGMETTFSVSAILKGTLSQKNLILHHYRLQDLTSKDLHAEGFQILTSAEKPLFVRFDIPAEDEYPKYEYLLFLKKEKDDIFVPVSGQVNAAISIKRLPDLANYILASGEATGWSKPVKGLRARLQILPSQKSDSPFCRVFIEFQNVDDVAGQKKIRFTPDKLDLRVTDKNGKELPIANGAYDGMSPLWEPTLLPYSGTLRFQISFPGLGYRPTDEVIIDVGSSKAWVVPQDGSTYYLSGSLSIRREKTDHPYMDWSGTLDLPKVEIPKQK